MNEIDFKEWLENPVTEYFKKYLNDYALKEAQKVAADILGGEILTDITQAKTIGECAGYNDISKIDLETIETFYDEG